MLIATFDDLLNLRHQAHNVGLNSHRRMRSPLSGLYASVFRGQGMDFDEVREYRHGDEIRNIDWRVTARMRKPYLKVYREERERVVMLCVDNGAHMQFGTRNTFKSVQAAKIAALLGWSAQGHGDRVGGVIFGISQTRFFRPTRTQRQFSQLLRTLCEPPTASTSSSKELHHILPILNRSTVTGGLLFLISDFHNNNPDSLRRSLSQLHQHHEVVLVNISDPADEYLPMVGRVRFSNAEGQQQVVNTDSAVGRQAYQQAYQARQTALQQLARQLNLLYFTIRTDDDAVNALQAGLRHGLQLQRSHR